MRNVVILQQLHLRLMIFYDLLAEMECQNIIIVKSLCGNCDVQCSLGQPNLHGGTYRGGVFAEAAAALRVNRIADETEVYLK